MISPKASRLLWFLLGFLPVVACGMIAGAKAVPALVPVAVLVPPTLTPLPSSTPTATATPTVSPTFTPPPVPTDTPTPLSTPTLIPDTGWELLEPGLERRVVNLFAEGKAVEQLYMLRLDPAYFQFEVAYQPQPQTLAQWQAQTGALIVLNGGYFRVEDEKYVPNGLTIVDGQAIGSSFGNFAGMFVVTPNGPSLRWLAQQPYDPNEPLLAALQSFPLLVKPGGIVGFPAENEDNKHARRTVIAQDKTGRILLLVTAKAHFTLHQLSVYLASSNLDLDIAINLDGGKSSGIIVASSYNDHLPAFSSLPVVITVDSR